MTRGSYVRAVAGVLSLAWLAVSVGCGESPPSMADGGPDAASGCTEGAACEDGGADAASGCAGDPDCSDGLFCNGAETCQAGACVVGPSPDCADGDFATLDSCDEATDACAHVPAGANIVCESGVCACPAREPGSTEHHVDAAPDRTAYPGLVPNGRDLPAACRHASITAALAATSADATRHIVVHGAGPYGAESFPLHLGVGTVVEGASPDTPFVLTFDGSAASAVDLHGGTLMHAELEGMGYAATGVVVSGGTSIVERVTVQNFGHDGVIVRAHLAADHLRSRDNAGDGIHVDAPDSEVRLVDSHLLGNGGDGIEVLAANPLALASTISAGRGTIANNTGDAVALGHETAQIAQVWAAIEDQQIFDNGFGIRVAQSDLDAGSTHHRILNNNIYNNVSGGIYITTSYQWPTSTADRRTLSGNDIHHNAISVAGCVEDPPGFPYVQSASQIVFDGKIANAAPAVTAPDPTEYPEDAFCYAPPGTAAPATELQCDRLNDPEDVLAEGEARHCIWTGSECRLAWDMSGTAGAGACFEGINRIFAYVNDPSAPEFTQKGLVATNGAFVLARRNTWGVAGADNATYSVSGSNSEIDFADACNSITTCTGPSPEPPYDF